jgi:hypothetical protein
MMRFTVILAGLQTVAMIGLGLSQPTALIFLSIVLFGVFGSYEVPYLAAAVVSAAGASVLSTAGPATFSADD